MPIYDFDCDCGERFSVHRVIALRDERAACPDCGGVGRRRVAAPRLAALSGVTRSVHERNERSAHEPRVHRREASPSSPAPAHHHAQGSGHGHGRPWMLGH